MEPRKEEPSYRSLQFHVTSDATEVVYPIRPCAQATGKDLDELELQGGTYPGTLRLTRLNFTEVNKEYLNTLTEKQRQLVENKEAFIKVECCPFTAMIMLVLQKNDGDLPV